MQVIYVIRKFSFLNQQLREHEERELSGRDSVVRDMLLMNGIEDNIRLEYETLGITSRMSLSSMK